MPGTATRDYYELLGVSPRATQDEVRKAYLKLAKKYHPDKTGGDKAAEEKLKAINEAYDTLKNAEKRREYDALRESPFAGGRRSRLIFTGLAKPRGIRAISVIFSAVWATCSAGGRCGCAVRGRFPATRRGTADHYPA